MHVRVCIYVCICAQMCVGANSFHHVLYAVCVCVSLYVCPCISVCICNSVCMPVSTCIAQCVCTSSVRISVPACVCVRAYVFGGACVTFLLPADRSNISSTRPDVGDKMAS